MTTLNTHLDNFATRLVTDALSEGTAAYWRRRAKTFDAVGTPTAAATAQACRNAALLATWPDPDLEAIYAEHAAGSIRV